MRADETELQMCIRHVAEQQARIARQEALIGRLRKSRSTLLDDALRLLAEMHGFLDAMRDQRTHPEDRDHPLEIAAAPTIHRLIPF